MPRSGPLVRQPEPPADPSTEQSLEQVVAELEPGVIGAEPLVGEELLEARVRRLLLLLTPVGAEAVVALALLGIGQHLVRLAKLLESILRVAVGVDVRVVRASQLAVRAADRVLIRVTRDAEHLVVVGISKRHSGLILAQASSA